MDVAEDRDWSHRRGCLFTATSARVHPALFDRQTQRAMTSIAFLAPVHHARGKSAPAAPRGRASAAMPRAPRVRMKIEPGSSSRAVRAMSTETFVDSSDDAPSTSGGDRGDVSDVRVRALRREGDIPRIATLCSAVFKETALPLPDDLADGDVMRDVADFLESRYESAMIKDLTGITTKNLREKRRCENQTRAEYGRTRARATSRELLALQRTRTSVDSLSTEQLREMRSRITDEVELELERERKVASPDYLRRVRCRQWMQLVADGTVPGGVATGLVSMPDGYVAPPPGTREIIGSATLQVCVPDAPLPPPFPTSRPYRSYLANMAVCPEARRRGVATSVIRYAERVSRLWGFDEMWLHVNIDNPNARALYESLGYGIDGEDPIWYLDRRYLMKRKLS